MAAMNTNKAQH